MAEVEIYEKLANRTVIRSLRSGKAENFVVEDDLKTALRVWAEENSA